MKCYFNHLISREAEGICQECGVYACRDHATIENGKFTCFSCSNKLSELNNEETLKAAEKIITDKYINLTKCSLCNIRYFESDDDHPSETAHQRTFLEKVLGKTLLDTLEYLNKDNIQLLCEKFPITHSFSHSNYWSTSINGNGICPDRCIVCDKHAPKIIGHKRAPFFSSLQRLNVVQCKVCNKTWTDEVFKTID